jgi:large subunit ribosomal protein L4
MKLAITKLAGGSAGEVELDEAVFGLEPRADLLARCVRWQLAKRRAGTHAVKNRSEINRTTKKVYKQKGTGNARHGAASAPQFRGGGRAFGPQVRSHEHDLPKKVRALALRHALSSKARGEALIVVDEARLDEGKTKALKSTFGQLGLSNALIIAGAEVDQNFGRAARNIPNIDVLPVQGINVYDILRREKLVLTRAAVEALAARFAGRTNGGEPGAPVGAAEPAFVPSEPTITEDAR